MIIRLECATGEARGVPIVWTWPSRRGQGQTPEGRANLNFRPDYDMLHWRPPHINGVQFAELDFYDIRGLSAVISRNVPNDRIRYILGATGEGRPRLGRVPSERVSCIDYVFINSDETVRAWPLSNPVLDDPRDLMIYCYRDEGNTRPATPSLRAHQYLHQDAVADWADSAAGHMGNMHYQALYVPPRFDYGNANRSGDHQDGDAPSVSLPASSGSSSDVADTRCKGQDSSGMPPHPVGDHVASAMARTPLAVKSLNGLNVPMSSDLLGRLIRGSETLNPGAPDDENLDVPKFKKTRLGASERESMKAVEVRIGGDQKGDNCEEQISKRHPGGSMAGGDSQNVMDEMVGRLLVVSK